MSMLGPVFSVPVLLLLSLLALQSSDILDLTHKCVVKMTCKKQESVKLHRSSWIYVYFLCAFSLSSDKQRISCFFYFI